MPQADDAVKAKDTSADNTAAEESNASVKASNQDSKESDSSDDKDTDLEDIEVSPDEIGDNDESEEEESESEEEVDDKADDESEEDESDTESEEESEEGDQSEKEKLKAFNKEMAEKRIQEKRQRELDQQTQQEEYLADAEDDKDLALRQLQVDAYNNRVEGNTNKLTNGYERALKDFDILRDKSPEVQAELDDALDSFQAKYVTVDAYGNPTDIRGDLYKHLQAKADSIKRLTGIGARQQSKNKAKEKSKTFTTPNRAPKEGKKDADLEAFDEEAAKY